MNAFRDHITADERLADASYRRVQLARAVAYLGDRWRGQTKCRHVYTNAAGERVEISAITGRELSRVKVIEAS